MNYILKKIEKKIYINNYFFNYYFFFILKNKFYLFFNILSFDIIFNKSFFIIKKYLKESGLI